MVCLSGLDLGRRHTENERKYRVYCRQVSAYHLGSWKGVYGRLSLFFWGWACGSVGLAVGKRSWRKRGLNKDRCCTGSCLHHNL